MAGMREREVRDTSREKQKQEGARLLGSWLP